MIKTDFKSHIKKLQTQIKELSSANKTLVLGFSFIFLGLYLHDWNKKNTPPGSHAVVSGEPTDGESAFPTTETASAADTLIPKDHVLIPIEIANQESLAALMGAFAIVDLYATHGSTKKNSATPRGEKIASHVKLLRAPLNPQKFAVLVHEHNSEAIVSYNEAFFVVVQSSMSQQGTKIEKKEVHLNSATEISYQN